MEKREDALREALTANAQETERWRHYEMDNRTAIENLEAFAKHLAVDVMVPVGGKSFMPGQLIHTNEVLVGHYQGYFSKCSAHKAKEICEHRIGVAEQRLQQLSVEAELWQNKLDKPFTEGVLPQEAERDIIEDYDEAAEQRWREEHKERVKQEKLRERAEREAAQPSVLTAKAKTAPSDEDEVDVLQLLEEAEMLEELEQELNKLEVEQVDDEMLRQLMAGEMDLGTRKQRTAHSLENEVSDGVVVPLGKLQGVVKKSEAGKVLATNNNSRPNPELLLHEADAAANDSDNQNDTAEIEELPAEVQSIREQAKFLPTADQIGFYEYQIQIIRQKLLTLPLGNQQEIDAKIQLLTVLEHVEELLEIAEETIGAAELAESEATEAAAEQAAESEKAAEAEPAEEADDADACKVPQKRRISFALTDETLEFRRNESVAEMMPKPQPQRDIIRLDGYVLNAEESSQVPIPSSQQQPSPPTKKQSVIEKVEEQRKFVAEHQSALDFDLVDQIIEAASVKTLHISFQHSAQLADTIKTREEGEEDMPGTPADFYDQYLKSLKDVVDGKQEQQPMTLFVNAYEGEDQVRAPVLREANRQEAYEDPRTVYSTPSKNTENNSKSILRNKNAAENEARIPVNSSTAAAQKPNSNKTRKKKSAQANEYMSAYNKVMQEEVVENPNEAPEPLPEGKFIDAHAPKKRVSRFKQMRAEKT